MHVIASPSTLTVGQGAQFTTIQSAINNASSGDTVLVLDGIYYENLVINKSVSLVGESIESTIIDGNRTDNVISITTSNVYLTGFTIRRSRSSEGYSGIHVEYSSGNIITNNKVMDNYHGISVVSSNGNVVSDNTIVSSSLTAIRLFSSDDNVVYGNIISTSYGGIRLYSSIRNEISNNTISRCLQGIILLVSRVNVISDNFLYSITGDGIYFSSSDDNVVYGNIISASYSGIYLWVSGRNVVSGNTIANNYRGIALELSGNNSIYHNNLGENYFNNTEVKGDLANFWDYNGEGNYWSDYVVQDSNEDGIGDSPYIINVNNRDNNPLMGLFSDFHVAFKNKIYSATVVSNSSVFGVSFEIGSETGNKIMRLDARGADGTVGFCRITIPTVLMNYPYFLLIGSDMIFPSLIGNSNETQACLYFTYQHNTHNISIVSSETWRLYSELLDSYLKLQTDFYDLNITYYNMLSSILANYSLLLANYSQLEESYQNLNSSYQEHLLDYSQQIENLRNLMYIFAATAAIFVASTVYLSKRAHARS